MKKTILIVHNYYQIPGGEDTVVANEKKLLEEKGHKVIVYSRHNNEIKKMNIFSKILLPLTAIYNVRTVREIKKIIQEEKIDVVHVHNTLSLISPSVYYAAIKMKKPVIQTIHNFRLLCPGATFYRNGRICEECLSKGLLCSLKHKCYRDSFLQSMVCVVNMKIHRMTGIYKKIKYICLTDFNKSKLLQLKQINSKQIYIKPNFTIVEKNDIIPFSKRKQRFVFAGRLDALKGIDLLLESWAYLGENAPELFVCGKGPLEKKCLEYIKKSNLHSVKMLGFVNHDDLIEIMAEAKAVILPTQCYEGFPMSIVEAYAVGTPVIVPNMGNSGNLVIHNLNGRKYNNNSSEELAKCVCNFPDMVNDTCRIYKENYSVESNYKRLMEIYEQI